MVMKVLILHQDISDIIPEGSGGVPLYFQVRVEVQAPRVVSTDTVGMGWW